MRSNDAIRRAIRQAMLASATAAAAAAGTAYAQDQEQEQAAAADQGSVDTVVVTGSRIPQPNLTAISPVSVIDDQEVASQGITQVEDLINNLPQAFADQGGNVSNGSTGTATVDLRNLGPTRTLVLVNGRRLPAGTPGGTEGAMAPDLNQIPAALIERVEVLTGGASAVYGSDAVAGVVNFIMKDDFEGVQIDVQHSLFQHSNDSPVASIVAGRNFALPESTESDGDATEVTLLMGGNLADGRGNVTAYLGWRELEPILQSERDYSACALGSNAQGFTCGGSGTNATGNFIFGSSQFTTNAAGAVLPFTAADQYNYGPLNYYQRPDERRVVGAFARYDLNEYAEVYSEIMVHNDRTVAQIAPSGLFFVGVNIQCNNPLLSAAQRATVCGAGTTPTTIVPGLIARRNVEGGGRQDDLEHTSYRGVIGVRGDVGRGWNYDVFAQYGQVNMSRTYLNEFSITRGQRALDVIPDPVTGQPVCRAAVTGIDANCVPLNIWRVGGVTQDALDYVQTPGFARGDTRQTVIGGSIANDFTDYGIKLPWADGGLGFAAGVEYREEGLTLNTDQAFTTGDLAGQGGPTIGVDGGINLIDYFIEARLPIIEGRPGAERLSIDTGYRYSDYSTGVQTDTYKVGLDWAPIQDVRFRGSFQRAVRAPNIRELFSAQAIQLFDLNEDPCAGDLNPATPTPAPVRSLAECQRTGVSAAQYGTILDNPAGQYNYLAGGNPQLDPESSDTTSFGIVLTPGFLPNFTLALDYFEITLEKAIGEIPPTVTLDQCLDTGDPFFCGLINRNAQGSLWIGFDSFIVGTNVNTGSTETSGVDLDANYQLDIGGFGRVSFNLIGTYLDKYIDEPVPNIGVDYDCAGFHGGAGSCGVPLPEWRHKLRATWATPWNIDLSLAWRYIDGVAHELTSTDPDLSGNINPVDREFPSFSYIDMTGAWRVTDTIAVRLGVNNLTDKDPPLSSLVGAGFGNGNTYPQVYEALGRYWFASATFTF